MNHKIAFEFEANTDFVDLRFPDGISLHIDRHGAEAGITKTVADHIALDTLVYNDPFAYVRLMLYGDPRSWLDRVTQL